MTQKALNTAESELTPGSMGITIEVQEYIPSTGDVVTVVPPRHWEAAAGGELRERPIIDRKR